MSAKILVVDDEPDLEGLILQKFRRQIRDGSVSFLFARDGVEALSMLDGNGDVDMVLTDINMPGMDGLSLLGKLQEADENLSTVIVSAYGDMGNIRTAMNRGAFDFITKPIDFVDLETTIAKTIRHVGILREARRRQLAAERAHASLSRYFSPNLAERAGVGWRDHRSRRAAPRDRDALHRHHRLHHTCRDARPGGAGAASERLPRRHDRGRLRA